MKPLLQRPVMRADDGRHTPANRRFVLSIAAAVVLGVAGQGAGHAAQTPAPAEGCAIVARHKAVFNKMPHGLSPFSTDAVLLGNGDVGLSISTTPLEKGSPVKKQDPGKIRFWFHKNDMWELGGPTTARLVAVMDATIGFDPAKPEPRCHVETDLLTATTVGTLAQEGGVSVAFRAWVSAVDNMVFLEFVSENGKIPCQFDLQVMKERSDSEQRDLRGSDGLYLRRSFPKGKPPTGVSMGLRWFGRGMGGELDGKRRILAFGLDSLTRNLNFATDVEKKMEAFDAGSIEKQYAEHKRWWAGFWNESWIEIPDKEIERQYYLANYLLASCCRNKDFPPGILTSWFCTDGPGWSNDYHLNYNYQAGFYSTYASNHVALGDVQDQPLLDYMPQGRKLAEERLKMPGILYPVGIGPKGTTTWGNDYGQKSNASYGAVNMIFRWKTTRDPEYAKKVWPYFKELTTFWEAYLTYEKDKDRYSVEHDSVHEGSGQDYNSIVSLALVRAVFTTALEISDALGVDRGKHEKWQHILAHLSPYATREVDGKTIFRYTEAGTEYWKGNTLGIQHVYPAMGIGLESDPELVKIARNTLEYMQRWFDNNGDTSFFPAAALLAWEPETIYQKLREFVTTQYRPNGLRNNKHGMEKVATVPNTVNLMMCSVHQGVMRVFPAWPKDADARFANLRQFGAFLVAAEQKGGVVRWVKITSEKGSDLTLVNPWPGKTAAVWRAGKKVSTVKGDKLVLKTRPGDTFALAEDGATPAAAGG